MKASIGQDSHRFDLQEKQKPFILGGIIFENTPALAANSDGDAVFHAITNAISGITCRNILGKVADEMCQRGITDSTEYLKVALHDLEEKGYHATHVSISIECLQPKISPKVEQMRESIGRVMGMEPDQIGITATTGEQLTDCGSGMGVSVLCILTVE